MRTLADICGRSQAGRTAVSSWHEPTSAGCFSCTGTVRSSSCLETGCGSFQQLSGHRVQFVPAAVWRPGVACSGSCLETGCSSFQQLSGDGVRFVPAAVRRPGSSVERPTEALGGRKRDRAAGEAPCRLHYFPFRAALLRSVPLRVGRAFV